MKYIKKGFTLVFLLVFLVSISNSFILADETEQWCFVPPDTCAITTPAICADNNGTLTTDESPNGLCHNACCCIWNTVKEEFEGDLRDYGYCKDLPKSVFNPNLDAYENCGDYCTEINSYLDDENNPPACMDGIDNDDDDLVDFGADPECFAPNDPAEDQTEGKEECLDTIDNDGDGLLDYFSYYEDSYLYEDSDVYALYQNLGKQPDPCCTQSFGVAEDCEFQECIIGEETEELCACGNQVCGFPDLIPGQENFVDTVPSYEWVTGNYCCEGVCSTEPCGDCKEGDIVVQSVVDPITEEIGDQQYVCTCLPDPLDPLAGDVCDYLPGTFLPKGSPEICADLGEFDDDFNNKANCMDEICYSVKCSDMPGGQEAPLGCTAKDELGNPIFNMVNGVQKPFGVAYLDSVDNYWKCCFPFGDANNPESRAFACKNSFDIPDTCGPCDCLELHKPAQELVANHVYGDPLIKLEFFFECQTSGIELQVMRCDGTPSECTEDLNWEVSLENSQNFYDIGHQIECYAVDGTVQYANNCFDSNGLLNPGSVAGELDYIEDTKILPNKDYTYVIKSAYEIDGEVTFSNVAHIQVGDKPCLYKTGQFCLRSNEEYGYTEPGKRFTCDDANILDATPCQGEGNPWPPSMCVEDFDNSGNVSTQCVSNTPCIFCGSPFSMFATAPPGITPLILPDAFVDDKNYNLAGSESLCNENLLCVYDYTPTIKDTYDSCNNIGSCADYNSPEACIGGTSYTGDIAIKNNCLPYKCNWISLYDASATAIIDFSSFPLAGDGALRWGYCINDDESYVTCDQCNNIASNAVFSYCSLDTCKQFSTSNTKCYIGGLHDECVDSSQINCGAYKDVKECTGGQPLILNLTYDGNNKVWGDNTKYHESMDELGFKICKWDSLTDKCFQDPDYDNNSVYGDVAIDITPPNTEVISKPTTDELHLKFAVVDANYEGRPTAEDMDGQAPDTYYCFPSANENVPDFEVISQGVLKTAYNLDDTLVSPELRNTLNYLLALEVDNGHWPNEREAGYCYPDELYILEEGEEDLIISKDNGIHSMFYYSEDAANNLEEVKEFKFHVDLAPPTIEISAYPILDDAYPFDDSSVLFLVELDEVATCRDQLEDYLGTPKINLVSGKNFQAVYDGLEDGTYFYTVICEDTLGNEVNASHTLKIEADSKIQATLPKGIIDYSPVNLEIKTTFPNGDCRIGNSESFDLLTSFEQSDIAVSQFYKHSTQVSLEEDGKYVYEVQCQFPDKPGKTYEDEIQFVYDTTPPTTKIIDVEGNDFDTTKWYSQDGADELVYFLCNDEPEFGFGCEETHYCLNDSSVAGCDTIYDGTENEDIEYVWYSAANFIPSAQPQWLCYQSQESIETDASQVEYGGKIESKNCVKILVDSPSGPVIEVDALKQHTSQATAYPYYITGYQLQGVVIDYDAENNPPPNNLVSIQVYSMAQDVPNEDGELEPEDDEEEAPVAIDIYQNLPANNEFDKMITLAPGLNKIVLTATDRSGKTSNEEYFIDVSNFDGNLIEIINPPMGVSNTKEFDLIVETPEELPTADLCVLSTNQFIGYNAWEMDSLPGKQFMSHINYPSLEEELYVPTFVKCDFPGGYSDIKTIDLVWDNTAPELEDVFINPSDRKDPPNIVEKAVTFNLTVVTNDKARCKLSTVADKSYFAMDQFANYEELDYINEFEVMGSQLEDGQSYTYYIQCDNGPTEPASNHISPVYEFTFKVDYSLQTFMELIEPEEYVGESSVMFELHSTKKAMNCKFGPTTETMVNQLATVVEGFDAFKIHTGGPIVLEDGKHTFYFDCLTATEGHVKDNFDFYVDTSAPLMTKVKTIDYSASLNTLTANWEADDPTTQITMYNFSIGTSAGLDDIYEWRETSNHKKTVSGLNLTNETSYWWNLKAQNSVGLWSEVVSNETYVDTSFNPIGGDSIGEIDLCNNGILNTDETDIDCGGVCDPCLNGDNCDNHNDCASAQCQSSICISASCEDSILNQQESDIDCGGQCGSCAEGMNCNINSDCEANFCKAGICTLPSCSDGVQNGQEQGIDCGADCMDECKIKESEKTGTCDDGIKNQNEEGIDCGGSCKTCEMPPDPNKDPEPKSSGLFGWFMILILIAVIAGGGYYYYSSYLSGSTISVAKIKSDVNKLINKFKGKPPKKPPAQTMNQQQAYVPKQTTTPSRTPIRRRAASLFKPLSKEEKQQKALSKKKQRSKIFDVFGGSESSTDDTPNVTSKRSSLFVSKSNKLRSSSNSKTEKIKLRSIDGPKSSTTKSNPKTDSPTLLKLKDLTNKESSSISRSTKKFNEGSTKSKDALGRLAKMTKKK
ncbi:hypothetical protein HN695_01210 [Candidatus Woesearchaeota archaeon]|nr:hypothetical protein [Candidatus Woesearchaeota archaeon]MBT5273019.1 hypothetical protein [Candidatus Woesearchaeota archaeon]MBT6040845.1 hypothetical protein [Candidatus Woesearchaeota archaeon]MBT6336722.1 hypothetical protein [Candidatus Woesearchaeota archaeon]MBT7926933.1 hypothetical protein [Candidatus Woesearchaeota archaeon]